MRLCLIDEPAPFGTLATWRRHLAEVRRLPNDVMLKAELVQAAAETVARLSPSSWHRPE
jgi:hypothetical protein